MEVQLVLRVRRVSKVNKGSLVFRVFPGQTGPAGPVGAVGATGPQGPAGPQGNPGVDGSIRVYGDGSAGPLNISANTNWSTTPPPGLNLQYTTCTVAAGATLRVPSGTIIRCSGEANIFGSIIASTAASGGSFRILTSNSPVADPDIEFSAAPPMPGFYSSSVPGFGMRAPANFGKQGGEAAFSLLSLSSGLSAPVSKIGTIGGGGGAGAFIIGTGGRGGGVVQLYAKDGITVASAGSISATGASGGVGGGGGAGGIIVLASPRFVTNNGAISIKGGNGGSAGNISLSPDLSVNVFNVGAGGGGSGGVLHLLSPSINEGTVSKDGGAQGGGVTFTNSALPSAGGGGGGSCGNSGGAGGRVLANATASEAPVTQAGSGLVIQMVGDPTSTL